ncbi:fluoride efflux transporter FluC [Microbacterium oxydans]|uniref:fluoride efflux transporter FluC n=1 Tax=Microbacterium oxydans TaxID=82380 RepID=UPI0005ED1521|nr:CrcB family protein [Microbacterium oxydans]
MNLRRILLVALGGTIGTAGRLALGLLLPEHGGFPIAVLLANIVGAFLIGVLAARPFGRLGDAAAAEVRLLLGTGMLGGFTTYSSFMTGTLALWADAPVVAAAYALGSLVLGLGAAALGLRLGRPRSAGGAA